MGATIPQACAWGYHLTPAEAGSGNLDRENSQACAWGYYAWGYYLMPAQAGYGLYGHYET